MILMGVQPGCSCPAAALQEGRRSAVVYYDN